MWTSLIVVESRRRRALQLSSLEAWSRGGAIRRYQRACVYLAQGTEWCEDAAKPMRTVRWHRAIINQSSVIMRSRRRQVTTVATHRHITVTALPQALSSDTCRTPAAAAAARVDEKLHIFNVFDISMQRLDIKWKYGLQLNVFSVHSWE